MIWKAELPIKEGFIEIELEGKRVLVDVFKENKRMFRKEIYAIINQI